MTTRASLTPAQMADLYVAGTTLAEIGRQVGRTEGRISQLIRAETGMSAREVRLAHGWFSPKISREVADAVVAVCESSPHLSIVQIAAQVGTSIATVTEVAVSIGWSSSRDPHALSVDQRAEVARRYRAGETTLVLAAAFGVSERTIRHALDDADVPRRGPMAGRRRTDDEVRDLVLDAYQRHGSVVGVCREVGISTRRTTRLLHEAEVDTARNGSDEEVTKRLVAAYRDHGTVLAASREAGVGFPRAKRLLREASVID